jgi:hypothetical protein
LLRRFAPRNDRIREDGSDLCHVKSREESKGAWDSCWLAATLPGAAAFGPMNQACPLVGG